MILVDVYVPAMNDSYDFMVDENVTVKQVIIELGGMLSKKAGETLTAQDADFQLYSMNTRKPLNLRQSLYMNQVTDGCRLLLI